MADAAGTSAAHRGLLAGQHRATTLHLGNTTGCGRLVCWDKHNSGFFLLPWYLQTLLSGGAQTPLVNISAVAFLQEGLPLYNKVGNPCSVTSALSWLLRSRVRSLQPRTSNASIGCEAILKAWLWSLIGLGTRCSGSSVLAESAS